MMIQILDLPPMPRNRSHMLTVSKGRPMNIKTPLCREFEKDLEQRLLTYADQFKKFKAEKPTSSYIAARYMIFTPKEILINKEDEISSRSVDLDAHKAMQDTIFRCMELDDKLVREVTYCTPISHDQNWNYLIEFYWRKIAWLPDTAMLTLSTATQTKETSESFALL